MKVSTAQLAGGSRSADRVFIVDNAVIVLDGATAFEPNDVAPETYAQALGAHIAACLRNHPAADLPEIVAASIRDTSAELDLAPGQSPSSTVSILRAQERVADLYVLGDSPIYYGNSDGVHVLNDVRLDAVALAEREYYVGRLRAGHGYDNAHREALTTLQRVQSAARNRPGGYWIAEADPAAALHGLTCQLGPCALTWAVLASDGAADILDYFGEDWSAIADLDSAQLSSLLHSLVDWEANTDPGGQELPRAKRHDDKTVVAVNHLWAR